MASRIGDSFRWDWRDLSYGDCDIRTELRTVTANTCDIASSTWKLMRPIVTKSLSCFLSICYTEELYTLLWKLSVIIFSHACQKAQTPVKHNRNYQDTKNFKNLWVAKDIHISNCNQISHIDSTSVSKIILCCVFLQRLLPVVIHSINYSHNDLFVG